MPETGKFPAFCPSMLPFSRGVGMIKYIIFVLFALMLITAPEGRSDGRLAIDAHWEQLLPSRPWLSLRILRLCRQESAIKVIS